MTMTTTTPTATLVSTNGTSPRLTTRELETSVGTLPVLGYSVQWNLSHIEISYTELVKALHFAGFSAITPPRPSPTLALRRAITRWVQQRVSAFTPTPKFTSGERESYDPFVQTEVEDEDDLEAEESGTKGNRKPKAHKSLLRKINSPQSEWLVFGLVIEQLDLAKLGLSYATRLRVFLHKKTLTIRVSQAQTGWQPDALDPAGKIDQAEAEAIEETDGLEPGLAVITTELRQLFEYYREHHQARDISSLLKQLVEGMDSFSLRWLGGVYFVPQPHQLALDNLYQLVEDLPATAGHVSDKFMLRLPILDGVGAKKQLAQAAHRDFIGELTTLEADLSRLSEEATHHQLRAETVARRLSSYRELKAKAQVYAELLDMQQERILTTLGQLTSQASLLLDNLSEPTAEEVGQQQTFDWDSLDLSQEEAQIHSQIEMSLTSI
jgi:hypothetical protein